MRRSKEDAEATRASLISAAEQLFAEKGIHNTRLSDVAQAVGVTRGAIYWHFKDKDELIGAVIERMSMPVESAMKNLLKQASDSAMSLEDLSDTLAFSFKRLIESPAVEQITRFAMRYSLSNQSPTISEQLRHNRDQNIARFTQILEHAQQNALVRNDRSAHQLALYVRAHVMGVYHQYLSSGDLYPRKMDDIRQAIDLLIDSLRPPQST